jgi:hypothetical protein
MNWAAAAVVLSLLTLVATIIGASYTHGKLTQRVDQNVLDINDHSERLTEHAERLGAHDVALGRLSEWKDGFNAASRVSGNKGVQ